jgi:hypothetical protein
LKTFRRICATAEVGLNTSDLNGKLFDWRHYGGHLAIWRLSQWVRFNVLGDTPPVGRKEPPRPKVEAYQQERLILKRIAEIPPDAIPLNGLPNLGRVG